MRSRPQQDALEEQYISRMRSRPQQDALEEQYLCAKARIHGWAGWETLKYVDAEEEEAFVANDFKSSYAVTMLLHAIVVAAWPVVLLTVRGKPAHQYLIHLTIGCFLVQFLARSLLGRLTDQHRAASLFGWVAYTVTITQWLCILHVDRSTGLAVYDDGNAS